MSAAPILCWSPGACPLAVHIVLGEIGEPFELRRVDTADGSTRDPAFLALNPKGRVPVLVHGDEVLTEANAILVYLASAAPAARLLPDSPLELARAIEWTSWLSSLHASGIAQLWRTERFADDPSAHAAIRAKGKAALESAWPEIETRLDRHDWALAGGYSIADPWLLVFHRWGHRLGLDMGGLPAWTAHADRMLERRAVRAAMAREGVELRR